MCVIIDYVADVLVPSCWAAFLLLRKWMAMLGTLSTKDLWAVTKSWRWPLIDRNHETEALSPIATRNWILPTEFWMSLEQIFSSDKNTAQADTLLPPPETLSRRFSYVWTSEPQKLWDSKYVLY